MTTKTTTSKAAANSGSLAVDLTARLGGVTVIIPTFNRARYIEECIDSLLAQTDSATEIIVVNDGSTDDTKSVLEKYRGLIKYIEKPNGGKSTALNLAIPMVRTEFVWFFDDDDVAHPSAIESHLNLHSLDPDLGFSFGFHEWGATGGDGKIKIVRTPQVPAVFQAHHTAQRLNIYRYCAFTLNACICKTDLVRSIGGFDEQLKRSQDYDFIIRLVQSCKFAFTGNSTYVIRDHDGPRGTADSLHASDKKRGAWIKYDKLIGKKLAKITDLSLYLPNALNSNGALTAIEARAGYINKAAALFSKALIEEGAQELHNGAQATESNDSLSKAELEALANATDHPYFRTEVANGVSKAYQALCVLSQNAIGRKILSALLRGIYWQLGRSGLENKERLTLLLLAARLWATSILQAARQLTA